MSYYNFLNPELIDRIYSHAGVGFIAGAWLVGSRAFNVETSNSDYDYAVAYVPTKPYLFGLHNAQNIHFDHGMGEIGLYPITEFVRLIEARNPNVDFIPYITETPHWVHENFQWMRPERFDNPDRALKSYYGYARGQYAQAFQYPNQAGLKRKMEFEQFGYIPKAMAHAIRILRMGIEYVERGTMQVYRTQDAAELREIRYGMWPVEKVKAEYESLLQSFPTEVTRKYEKSNNEDDLVNAISAYL